MILYTLLHLHPTASVENLPLRCSINIVEGCCLLTAINKICLSCQVTSGHKIVAIIFHIFISQLLRFQYLLEGLPLVAGVEHLRHIESVHLIMLKADSGHPTGMSCVQVGAVGVHISRCVIQLIKASQDLPQVESSNWKSDFVQSSISVAGHIQTPNCGSGEVCALQVFEGHFLLAHPDNVIADAGGHHFSGFELLEFLVHTADPDSLASWYLQSVVTGWVQHFGLPLVVQDQWGHWYLELYGELAVWK